MRDKAKVAWQCFSLAKCLQEEVRVNGWLRKVAVKGETTVTMSFQLSALISFGHGHNMGTMNPLCCSGSQSSTKKSTAQQH